MYREELYNLYMLTLGIPPSNFQPRLNACPTTTVDVVVSAEEKRAIAPMCWGIIPGWWNKPKKEMKLATFNARAETIATKPMFRDSFKKRRCLMPVSGYYEWHTTPEGKRPYYFTRRDGQVMTIAAIQDVWNDPETGERIRSCAMVITEPNRFVAEVHDRMPVLLEAKDFEQWERGTVEEAASLMKSAHEELLDKRPVSKRVNSSRTSDDDHTLIDVVSLAA